MNIKHVKKVFFLLLLLLKVNWVFGNNSISSISPNKGTQGDSFSVVMTGSGVSFSQGSGTINKVWLNKGPDEILLTNSTLSDSKNMNADLAIPSDAHLGVWDVFYVQDTDTFKLVNGFTVLCQSVNLYQELTFCESAEINGKTYTVSQIVVDTLLGSAGNGCDSIITTDLIITGPSYFHQNITAIDSAFINGDIFRSSQTIVDTLIKGTILGCDSILTTILEIKHSDELASISPNKGIQGEAFSIIMTSSGTNFSQGSGTINKAWLNRGPDEIQMTNVSVASYSNLNASLSIPIDAYLGVWDVHYVQGTDTLILEDGFSVLCQPVNFTQSLTGCNNIEINGNVYSESQTVIDTLLGVAANECDSIITTFLTVTVPVTFEQNITVIDSVEINGEFYETSQTIVDTLIGQSILGCDSIITTNLEVNYSRRLASINPDQGVQGTSFPVIMTSSRVLFSQGSGTINKAWLNNGPNDILIDNISVTDSVTTSANLSLLSDANIGLWDVYFVQDSDTFKIENGFTVLCQPVLFTQNLTSCSGIYINGNNYTKSQTIVDTLFEASYWGCDSIVTTILTVDFSLVNDFDFDFTDLSFDFKSSVSNSNNNSYLWDFGDGNTSAMKDPSHEYLDHGNYNICLYLNSECGLDTICKNVSTLMVGNNQITQTIKEVNVFPNPFVNDIDIKFYLIQSENIEITIHDAGGKIVYYKDSGIFEEGDNVINIRDLVLENGVYYFQLKTESGLNIEKILKLK